MANKDQPLRCTVANGKLTISIGIDTLAYAFENGWRGENLGRPRNPFYKVTDPFNFAKEVRNALWAENEVGATTISDVLDAACLAAVDDGAQGIRELRELTVEELNNPEDDEDA